MASLGKMPRSCATDKPSTNNTNRKSVTEIGHDPILGDRHCRHCRANTWHVSASF